MTWALVASAQIAGNANGGTSGTIDTTGATLLILAQSQYSGATLATPTDSKGNTWVGLTAQTGLIETYTRLWYAKNPTVGAGHTFTDAQTGAAMITQIEAWSGADTTAPLDVQNGAHSGGTATTQLTGSVTPSQANSLIVTAQSNDYGSGGAATINTGFTISNLGAYASSVNEGGGLAHLVLAVAAPTNPTWTMPGSSPDLAAVIAVFKPSSATTFSASVTDTVASSDAVTGVGTFSSTVADTSASSETLTGSGKATSAPADTAASSDTTTGTALNSVSVTDSSASSDAVSGSYRINAAVVDTSASSDATTGVPVMSAIVTDTVVSSDALTASMAAIIAVLTDTVASFDAVIAFITVPKLARGARPPTAYAPGSPPVLPDPDNKYLAAELAKISASISSTILLIPQAATSVPKTLIDGMHRLARAPWRPIGGTTDVWVYYDLATTSWLAL